MRTKVERKLTGRGTLLRRNRRFKEFLRPILTSLGRHHADGSKKDIVLLSTARSGTTWLMECLAAEPRLRFVNEPFTPRFREVIPAYRGGPLSECAEGYALFPESDELTAAMRGLLADVGMTRICGPYNPLSPTFKLLTDRRIFKVICAAQAARNWAELAAEFELVFLARHPIATCLSRQREYRRPDLGYYLKREEFVRRYLTPAMVAEVERSRDPETPDFDARLVEWCLEHVAPQAELGDEDACPWFFYENLREDFESGIKELAECCALEDPAAILARASVPSASTHPSRQKDIEARTASVPRWLEEFPDDRFERAQELLDLFDIRFYRARELKPVASGS